MTAFNGSFNYTHKMRRKITKNNSNMQAYAHVFYKQYKKLNFSCVYQKKAVPLQPNWVNMDSFEQLCQKRRSIRKYTDRPVEQEKIDYLLRCALMSPSAKRTCPWEFVVVKDPAKLAALAARLPNSRVGNGAKLAIVVCGSLDNGLPGRSKEYWIHDCSAATMNLLLAAHAQGLGAVWTGVYPGEERVAAVREVLSIPDGYMPLNVIPVGYPAENPPAKDKWNPAKIHYDKW